MKLSDINNKTISGTLTDFELAKTEDNTPEKLAGRAADAHKIKTQLPVNNSALQLDRAYTANENGDMVNERGEFCGSVDYETGKVKIAMSAKQPINPANGKPYFEIRDDAWSGEWVAGEVKPIPNSEFGGDDE